MTSSSSEEENECLREAVDPSFFYDNLFSGSKPSKCAEEKAVKLPSLRNQNNQTTFNPLEIKATPEFRAHVSKHLRKMLDGLIDYTQESQVKKRKANTKKGGVRLLRNSSDFVLDVIKPDNGEYVKRKYVKRQKRSNESDYENRAREVAVTAEWILSGQATQGWDTRVKGEVEVIKIK